MAAIREDTDGLSRAGLPRQRHARTLAAWVALLATLLAVHSAGAPAFAQDVDPRNIVVMLEFTTPTGEMMYGAGIVIAQDDRETLIVTAGHNLRTQGMMHSGVRVSFRTQPGRAVAGEPVPESVSRNFDIGLLRVDGADAPSILDAAVPTGILHPSGVGPEIEPVYVVGHGGGTPWSHTLRPEPARRVSVAELEIQSPAQRPGQSGGGVFDQDWSLVGMLIEVETPIARALSIDLVLDEVRRGQFGVSLRANPLAARDVARRTLADRNVPWTAAGLSSAIRGLDLEVLRLFIQADVEPAMLLSGFLEPVVGGGTVAHAFFELSRGHAAAIDWLRAALARGLDPNATVPGAYYAREGLLIAAIRAGNAAAALALVEAGASPHAFQDLWFTTYPLERFLMAFDQVVRHETFTRDEKRALLERFVAAGGILPAIDGLPDGQPQISALARIYRESESLAGVRLTPSPGFADRPRTAICERASARDGFDWCGFVEALPIGFGLPPETPSGYHSFISVDLLGLMHVADGRAYMMGVERVSYSPGFVMVEISRDARSWRVYRFMPPGAGLGLCREEDGFRRDRCWRRLPMTYDADRGVMMVDDYYPYPVRRR